MITLLESIVRVITSILGFITHTITAFVQFLGFIPNSLSFVGAFFDVVPPSLSIFFLLGLMLPILAMLFSRRIM